MNALDLFHFDDDRNNFEQIAKVNGRMAWSARDLMQALGYESWTSFKAVINRAIAACMALEIDVQENFEQKPFLDGNGRSVQDYKLSRFACYLVAMNGDPKKTNVARAQVYFIAIAETFTHYLEESENVERVLIREEVSDREVSLAGVAKQYGVTHYPFFQNAGYRGMYNMNISELRKLKGLGNSKRSPLDFMGKEELAANLFRVTQTESKIKNTGAHGQSRLEAIAEDVGRQVRRTMLEISGNRPEDLPVADDVNEVRKQIKGTHRKLAKLDTLPKDK